MATVIPLVATGDQKLTVNLAGQQCSITLSQKEGEIYMDLLVGTRSIIRGAVCRDRVYMVRSAYLGFIGNLGFVDTQGVSDPDYTGLGSRWKLVYFP